MELQAIARRGLYELDTTPHGKTRGSDTPPLAIPASPAAPSIHDHSFTPAVKAGAVIGNE